MKNKYQVPKSLLLKDKIAKWVISFSGISIILAVCTILGYILFITLPLTQNAELTQQEIISLPKDKFDAKQQKILTCDEWSRKPTFIFKDHLLAINLKSKWDSSVQSKKTQFEKISLPYPKSFNPVLFNFTNNSNIISSCNEHNEVFLTKVNYKQISSDEYFITKESYLKKDIISQKSAIEIVCSLQNNEPFETGIKGQTTSITYNELEEKKLLVLTSKKDNDFYLHIFKDSENEESNGLFDEEEESSINLSLNHKVKLIAKPIKILASSQADTVIVSCNNNKVYVFRLKNDSFIQIQDAIEPFQDTKLVNANFIYGSQTVIFSDNKGNLIGYSLYKPQNDDPTKFNPITLNKTKNNLPKITGQETLFCKTLSNKAYLIASKNNVQLQYMTSQSTNWQDELTFTPKQACFPKKYNSLFLADNDNLYVYKLDDPHPESSWSTFFGSTWYEGQSEPKKSWQSSGSNDSEKQLSLIPLIFGTLKATFYAMLFSVPLAILAAIYTSQFMRHETKAFIKPAIEIMAALPSVVIGFIAALWLAEKVEEKMPSIFMMIFLTPLISLLIGYIWKKLPKKIQLYCPDGREYLFLMPIIIITLIIAWNLGPSLEKIAFAGSFSNWWRTTFDLDYTQRNAIIVGMAMGFAIIPLIYTISDDALSNVPSSLKSASIALGASRWQTTYKVVLPYASPGIFSATMIGLGRAVGETMIVLCAAGGTALLEWNPYNGMRPLSLNLATELPEAPKNSTLFRTLFLGALVLFLMTFLINTTAEVIRQKIKKKHK